MRGTSIQKRKILSDAEARAYIAGKPEEPTAEELEIKHVEYLVRNEMRRINDKNEKLLYARYPENSVNRIQHYINNHQNCPNVDKLEAVLQIVKGIISDANHH